MKQDKEMKIFEDRINKISSDLKVNKNEDMQKLSKFKEITKQYVDKAKVIDPKNYSLNYSLYLQYSTTEFIANWLEYLTEKMYEIQMVICENWKIMLVLNNEIDDDKERKEKLEELENIVKKMQYDRKKYQEYFALLDKSIEIIKEKEKELTGRGVYG